jgi:dolichyl-diphosphooligosaccharide--protein glycosyltransferase
MRDWLAIAAIVLTSFVVRTYPAWNAVFDGQTINFLETDAWYHVRLVENQVRNYPWRVTLDPYAASGGQFVAIAPLFDTLTATAVVAVHGRDASTREIERVAVFAPPIYGALTVFILWLLGRQLFEPRAATLGAALLAVLPGHFMDRTMLGFVDHHALEALLAVAALTAIVHGLQTQRSSDVVAPLMVGTLLGLYLLTWSSGAFFLAIVGVWLCGVLLMNRDTLRASRLIGLGALAALVLVAAFQDPRMHRYGSQLVGLVGLIGISLCGLELGRHRVWLSRRVAVAGVLVVFGVGPALAWFVVPDLVRQIAIDVGRLSPDPSRMGVLEARPLFLYPGEWTWRQPWIFFRSGFYLGLAAIVLLALRCWRAPNPGVLLCWVYAVATFAATIGQNRFGYYLVTACALLGGWLADQVLKWGDARSVVGSREIAAVIVAAGMFAPNLAPSILLMPRTATLSAYWQDAMGWLRRETPPPFLKTAGLGDEYYDARYPRDTAVRPEYTIMNWWDQGYWLIQRARRVPVSNPTQERASHAARFYAETDERRAMQLLAEEGARYVLSDWELPYRLTAERNIMGRFQSVLDWAGATHSLYYEVYYQRNGNGWTPVWVFHGPYYQSMTFRLVVLGGTSATPVNATTVLTVADRVDGQGAGFREVIAQRTYPTYEDALAAAAAGEQTVIVGLDPWQAAVPVPALTTLTLRHDIRTAAQQPTESPWVRIFEVR